MSADGTPQTTFTATPVTSTPPLGGLFGARSANDISHGTLAINVNSEDYETKYPPDPYCKELGPDARVWRVYLDEAQPFNLVMVENLRDSLDLMLVFAGLFSAVVATTATQSSLSLQPDPAEYTNLLLQELIRITSASGSSGLATSSALNFAALSSTFTPAPSDQWVNRLWFTSLSFSLAAALFAVLAKQWLLTYTTKFNFTSNGTGMAPLDRARLLQFRYLQFQRWGVPMIIGVLPVLIHLALLVYFAGLVTFLVPLDLATGVVVGCVGGLSGMFYFVTSSLPVFVTAACPYQTPFTTYSYWVVRQLRGWKRRVYRFMARSAGKRKEGSLPTKSHKPRNLQEAELEIVDAERSLLELSCLRWLTHSCTNPSATSIVYQALSNIPLASPLASLEQGAAFFRLIRPKLQDSVLELLPQVHLSAPSCHEKLERLSRAMVRLYKHSVVLGPRFSSDLPPVLQATLLDTVDSSKAQAPLFLAANYSELLLPASVWLYVIERSLRWIESPNAKAGFAEVQKASWDLAKASFAGFIPFISCGDGKSSTALQADDGRASGLLECREESVYVALLDYLHRLFCSTPETRPHLSSPELCPRHHLHLAISLLHYGEQQQTYSSEDSKLLMRHIKTLIDDRLGRKDIARWSSRSSSRSDTEALAWTHEVFDVVTGLVSSGKFFRDSEWYSPVSLEILSIFRALLRHHEHYKFDSLTIRNLLLAYKTVEHYISVEKDDDHFVIDLTVQETILLILSDAFQRKSASCYAYFKEQKGLEFLRDETIFPLVTDRDVLCGTIHPDMLRHHLVPIADLLYHYATGLLASHRTGQNVTQDLAYLFHYLNLRFFVSMTFRHVMETPRYLPAWSAVNSLSELARLVPVVFGRDERFGDLKERWEEVGREVLKFKAEMIERATGGRWISTVGQSLSASIKELKMAIEDMGKAFGEKKLGSPGTLKHGAL